jgi:8-oxo-dGTP pyrophosphatase MutT (NUDIX family)
MGGCSLLEKHISSALTLRRWKHINKEGAVKAAVLLLLLEVEGSYHILFTKRSYTVAHHKGEVSFPGGTVDPGDPDFLYTALREGHEEIGVQPKDVTILGRLDDIMTATTGFVIAPYVGVISHPYNFQVNPHEIATLIFVPLDILKELCREQEQAAHDEKNQGMGPCFRYRGHIIWGATARILMQFMSLVCRL